MKLIPRRIQPYFNATYQTKDGDNNLIKGTLTCCNAHDFEVFVVGEIKHSAFSKMRLYPENDETIMEVRCRKCGKTVLVFDSSCDGYAKCGKDRHTLAATKLIDCKVCHHGSFFVDIKYEYPDIQELKELEITEIDNAFTWIWISLECSNCGTRYKNFVDCETS